MKKLILLTLLLVPIMVHAQKPEELVHNTASYVDDYADIYTPTEEQQLGAVVKSFFDTVQIAVVTVKSLEGYDISDFAVKLFNKWGVGSKSNNGLLLLIAPNEHKAWATTGRAIQGDITDLQAARLQREIMVPRFKNKEYFEGTRLLLLAYIDRLSPSAKQYRAEQEKLSATNDTSTIIWILIMSGAVIVTIVFFVRRANRKRLEREDAERRKYDVDRFAERLRRVRLDNDSFYSGIAGGYLGSSQTGSFRSSSRNDDNSSSSSSSSSSSNDYNSSSDSSSMGDSGSDFGGGSSDGGGGGSDW